MPTTLNQVIRQYLVRFPDEKTGLAVLLGQVQNGEKLDGRKNFTGHVVGSALIFSSSSDRVLLINHPSLGRWIQPGGHWDEGEAGPWEAAKREAIEETGVDIQKNLSLDDKNTPLLIESHLIPARDDKNEPEHYHHAFWYGYVASSEDLKLDDDVVKEAKWLELDKINDSKIQAATHRAKQLLKA